MDNLNFQRFELIKLFWVEFFPVSYLCCLYFYLKFVIELLSFVDYNYRKKNTILMII